MELIDPNIAKGLRRPTLLYLGPSRHELSLLFAILSLVTVWYCIILWPVSMPRCVKTEYYQLDRKYPVQP